MIGQLASRIGLMALMVAALIAAEPRLTLAFEQVGDPRPKRFALTSEVMVKALGIITIGLVISWSDGRRQLLR